MTLTEQEVPQFESPVATVVPFGHAILNIPFLRKGLKAVCPLVVCAQAACFHSCWAE